MAKTALRVPPKHPEIGDVWTREDEVQFIWTGSDKGWARL